MWRIKANVIQLVHVAIRKALACLHFRNAMITIKCLNLFFLRVLSGRKRRKEWQLLEKSTWLLQRRKHLMTNHWCMPVSRYPLILCLCVMCFHYCFFLFLIFENYFCVLLGGKKCIQSTLGICKCPLWLDLGAGSMTIPFLWSPSYFVREACNSFEILCQTMREIINDKRYGALRTLGERKQAFNEVSAVMIIDCFRGCAHVVLVCICVEYIRAPWYSESNVSLLDTQDLPITLWPKTNWIY